MTGNTIINAALTEIKVIRPGQTPNPSESAVGLSTLNNMLDSFSTDRLMIPSVNTQTFPLTAFHNFFIGPTAAAPFNVPRPIRIDKAGIIQTLLGGNGVALRTDLKIASQQEFIAIADKGATADIPDLIYYEPYTYLGGGVGTLYVWPAANVSTPTSLEMSMWLALTAFPDLVSDIGGLVTGYARMLIKNLAVELAAQFPASQLSQETMNEALESRAAVMKLNSLLVPEQPDIAIPPQTSVQFQPVPSTLKAVAQAKTERGG